MEKNIKKKFQWTVQALSSKNLERGILKPANIDWDTHRHGKLVQTEEGDTYVQSSASPKGKC